MLQALLPAAVSRVRPLPVVLFVNFVNNVEKGTSCPVRYTEDTHDELQHTVDVWTRCRAFPSVKILRDTVASQDAI